MYNKSLCTIFHFTLSTQHEYNGGLKNGDNKGYYIMYDEKGKINFIPLPSHLVVLF